MDNANAQYSLQEFGQRIKAKYPQYKSMGDEDVANAVIKKYPQYQSSINQQPQDHPIIGFLKSIGLGIVPETAGAITNIPNEANFYMQKAQGNPQALQNYDKGVQANPLIDQNLVQSAKNHDLGGVGKHLVQDAAGAASYMVPFGKGAGILSKVLLPGAASGGLQAASQTNATPGSVVAGAGAGAAGAGVMHGVTSGINNMLDSVANKASGGLEQAGNKIIRSQYNIPKGQAISGKILDTVSELNNNYGLSHMDKVSDAADLVTGKTGIVNSLKQEAIANAGPVETGGIIPLAKGQLSKYASIPSSVEKKAMDFIKKGVFGGDIQTPSANGPQQMFHFTQELDDQAAGLRNSANTADRQLSKVYQSVSNELKTRLFDQSGANSKIRQLTPEEYQTLHSVSPALAQKVAGASTIKDLRAIEAPFVRLSKAAEQTSQSANNSPLKATDWLAAILGGVTPQGLGALAVKKYLESNTGKAHLGGLMSRAGKAEVPQVGSKFQTLLDMLGSHGASSTTNP